MKFFILIFILLISVKSISQNDIDNKYFVNKISYNSAEISTNKIHLISLKFKTQFIIAETDDFELKKQDVVDKISNDIIGSYSEKFININKEGKIRIKFDFANNKIDILKDNKIISVGVLMFENNQLKEIVFSDLTTYKNYSIIKTWAVLNTVNILYGYDVNKSLREGIIYGGLIGSFL